MNPDEALIKQIIQILEEDTNKLQQILKNLDKQSLEQAFFVSQEIHMYIYKLYSILT